MHRPSPHWHTLGIALLSLSIRVQAWEPNTPDLDLAIRSGEFGAYHAGVAAWLNQKSPTEITTNALMALIEDEAFVKALDQYQFISVCSPATLGEFARADEMNRKFLGWLMNDVGVMDLYLEAGPLPSGQASIPALSLWSRIFNEDPDSRQGIYLKIAMATAIVRPTPFRDERDTPRTTEPYEGRYLYFKTAHQNGELAPTFDQLSVWEVQKVVDGMGAPPEDLTWVKQMIRDWRPDLIREDRVVNIVSEVRYGGSDIPIVDMASVMDAGGICGRRSHFGRKTCAAFGIPSIAILQKNHAALAMIKNGVWKVEYGAGWPASWCENGVDGWDFIAEAVARSHRREYSQVQHLKWFASALSERQKAEAIVTIAEALVPRSTDPNAMATIPETQSESEADGVSPQTSATRPQTQAQRVMLSLTEPVRIPADHFHSMTNVMVYVSLPDDSGNQVNFQKNMNDSWIDYRVDVPAAGLYALVLKAAAPNRNQLLYLSTGAGVCVTNTLPNTRGLWQTIPACELALESGEQTLRIAAPFQRGIAIKWLELSKVQVAQ